MQMQACDVTRAARGWLGVPFAHQGRSRCGVDCLGLLVMVASELGLAFENKTARACDEVTYGHRPDTQRLYQALARYLVPVDRQIMAPADIALMQVEGLPQHLAIISDYPQSGQLGMIHAYAPARKVVEHRLCEHWRTQLHAAFRLPHLS